MRPERLGCVVGPRQFRLAQCGMNLAVADVMQQDNRPALAAFQLGDQVMQALRYIRRDRAVAKGADGVGHAKTLIRIHQYRWFMCVDLVPPSK